MNRSRGILAAVAVVVAGGARLLLAQQDDPSSPTLPPRDVGDAVDGTSLTTEEVCGLLRPRDLRAVYDLPFGRGVSTGSSDPAGCRWTAAGTPLEITVVSVPPLAGGDANATYELLRPDSPSLGFDSTSGVGDEAFFSVTTASDPSPNRSDRMVVRSGGVILQFSAVGDTEPAGGLDALAEVGRTAVAHLPPQG